MDIEYLDPDPEFIGNTIQGKINSNNGYINEKKLDEYKKTLLAKGYSCINPSDINSINKYIYPGDRIAYRTKDNKWRSGGFVIQIYEVEQEEDKNKKNYYICFKPFNPRTTGVSVQMNDITELWHIRKDLMRRRTYNFDDNSTVNTENTENTENLEEKYIEFKNPTNITNYPVSLPNKNGKEIIVYYAESKSKQERFMNTDKFKNALKYGWRFKN